MLNRFSLSNRKSDTLFGSDGGFYLARWTCSDEKEREETEKMKHTYSQCALDRSNRTDRDDKEENHTHMYHRSIDRQTRR